MKIDLSNTIAAEMDKVLNSDESKQMFSSSSMLEKIAFRRVSEADEVTEVEALLEASLTKTAGCCECEENAEGKDCKCECHKDHKKSASNLVRNSFNALLKISEDLDNAGFDRLAAISILLADKLVVEAKAKSSKKSDKKSDKSKDKSKGKKMDMKDRMKKMREMQKGKGKKDDKKSSKKSDKKSEKK